MADPAGEIAGVVLGAVMSFMTGPLGGSDIPAGDLADALARRDPASVTLPGGATLARRDGTGLPVGDYPEHLVRALTAVEDSRFREHSGIDAAAAAAAAASSLGGSPRGGSTLTQQLVKLRITGGERSLARKVVEGALAARAETVMSKDAILEGYLSSVWAGRGVTGMADAADAWFGTGWPRITPGQSLGLVAMLKGPGVYDMERGREAFERRWRLLAPIAGVEGEPPVPAPARAAASGGSAWAVSSMRRSAERLMSAGVSGEAETLIEDAWEAALGEARAFVPEGAEIAVVAVRPATGAILASLGGRGGEGFDRAAARRQPGSAAKPFLYLAALEAGMRPGDLVSNEPIRMRIGGEDWAPGNADGSSGGFGRLMDGLVRSSNLMTVHLADSVNLDDLLGMAERFGAWPQGDAFRSESSLLGTALSSPEMMAAAYAGIVNGGRPVRPSSIRVGGVGPEVSPFPVVSPDSVAEILAGMREVVTRGTAAGAFRGGDVVIAGKTGTSQGSRDGWFVAVTPSVSLAVWMGRDDDRPVPGLAGGQAPAKAARAVLERAMRDGLIGADGIAPGDVPAVSWPPDGSAPSEPALRGWAVAADGGRDAAGDPSVPEDDLTRALRAATGHLDW